MRAGMWMEMVGPTAALPQARLLQAVGTVEGPYPTCLSERGSPAFKPSFTMRNHSSRPNWCKTTHVVHTFSKIN